MDGNATIEILLGGAHLNGDAEPLQHLVNALNRNNEPCVKDDIQVLHEWVDIDVPYLAH